MRTKASILFLLSLLVCASACLLAQPAFQTIRIPRVSSPPKLEEFLNMEPGPRWTGKLAKVDQFTQRIPRDGAPVSQRTEAYLGYDDKNLYAIFICFDSEPEKLRARLSRREDIFDDDTVEIMPSLVGSEMCIRDRVRTLTNPLIRSGTRQGK